MVNVTSEKQIRLFRTENGIEPFAKWMDNLKDKGVRDRISTRIHRLKNGNYGDYEPVGEGVYELRFFFGAGYRVYFAEQEDNVIILLCGGDKSTQNQDIKKAHVYWREYKENEKL